MKQFENLLKQGMVTVSEIDDGYGLLFEPNPRICEDFKLQTVLIKRQALHETFEALESYLNDPFRGADDYPVSFFDPSSKLTDYDQ